MGFSNRRTAWTGENYRFHRPSLLFMEDAYGDAPPLPNSIVNDRGGVAALDHEMASNRVEFLRNSKNRGQSSMLEPFWG